MKDGANVGGRRAGRGRPSYLLPEFTMVTIDLPRGAFPSSDAELLAWSRGVARRLAGGSDEMGETLAGAFVAVNARLEAARASVASDRSSRAARAEVVDAVESMRALARRIVDATRVDPSATIARIAA